MRIRLADESDAPGCLRIYERIVRETATSFEEAPPTVEEMAQRIRETLSTYPWLVCCDDNTGSKPAIVGYAYANSHRKRAAYRWAVESAMYVDANQHGKGIGRRLYLALFDILRRQGYRTVVAGTTLPNDASVAIHQRLGFEPVGVFRNIGFKFNSWHDTQWFELNLNTSHAPAEPVPLSELSKTVAINDVLEKISRTD